MRKWGAPKEDGREAHRYVTHTFATLTNRHKMKAFYVAIIKICLKFPFESICTLVLEDATYLLNVWQK